MTWRTALAFALAAALAALPAGAHAASISYIGPDGNAYLTTPDGARSVQLTKDATAESKYKMAGQADDGQIVVHREKYFSWLNPDGTTASGPWRFGDSGVGAIGPVNAHVAPGGSLVVVDWNSGPFAGSRWSVVKMPRGPHAFLCAFGCVDDVVRPRWVPGAEAGFLSENLSVLSVQVPGQAAPQGWLTIPTYYISSFDVSRTGLILVEAFPEGGGTPPKTLALFKSNGLPPSSPQPAFLCELPNFSTAGGFPHWSPDGTMIAWEDPAGVQVSPAPVNQSGTCVLSPRLVAAGGRSPDWGLKDVPTAPKPPPVCGEPGQPACERPSELKVKLKAGRLPKLGTALRRGLTFALETERAGRAVVELVASGKLARGAAKRATKVVARGSKTVSQPGTVKVKVRFTRKAKRRYRSLRKLTLSARATVTDGVGAKSVTKRKVVLKR